METFAFGLICTCNPQYGESREVVLVTDGIGVMGSNEQRFYAVTLDEPYQYFKAYTDQLVPGDSCLTIEEIIRLRKEAGV